MGQSDKTRSARIKQLALLPVFYRLEGEAVLIAGGSAAAAWKAELVLAAGASVRLYASEIGDELGDLISRHPGRVELHAEEWGLQSFSGARLAILDSECDVEAAAFLETGRVTGVPVNVIDNPSFCQFQFGSIVNRSPAIVSISTDGAAPILGQAIRRRIEAMLPNRFAAWTALAQRIRPQVNKTYEMGSPRRAFWERFVDRAFSGSEADETGLFQQAPGAESGAGSVTLVGAGPGDAELLTLKAMRALQRADVILFDDLVSDEVLELARREAKRMLVGKRGGRSSCKQDDINNMMLSLARAGRSVVRLKAGDPMIFGRGGEEIAFLERHGIAVEVVPGITAASGMAAALGVSMTHRDHAQSLRFITGHSRQGKLPETVDWQSVAAPNQTTIFYMGGRTAPQIQAAMLSHGATPDTPVVIATSVSRLDAETWAGSLGDLAEAMARIGTDNPVLIGVGDVFARAKQREHALPPKLAIA